MSFRILLKLSRKVSLLGCVSDKYYQNTKREIEKVANRSNNIKKLERATRLRTIEKAKNKNNKLIKIIQ